MGLSLAIGADISLILRAIGDHVPVLLALEALGILQRFLPLVLTSDR